MHDYLHARIKIIVIRNSSNFRSIDMKLRRTAAALIFWSCFFLHLLVWRILDHQNNEIIKLFFVLLMCLALPKCIHNSNEFFDGRFFLSYCIHLNCQFIGNYRSIWSRLSPRSTTDSNFICNRFEQLCFSYTLVIWNHTHHNNMLVQNIYP